jgi:4-hydroxy-tetrahydrodipicolinate reductase
VRLAVLGATGRLGRLIVARALATPEVEQVTALSRPGSPSIGLDVGALVGPPHGQAVRALEPGCMEDVDVLIDVSLPGGLAAAEPHLGRAAVVSGVTGHGEEGAALLARLASGRAVLHTANFSTGVHVLADLVARAARALPDHDVEIVEAHHRGKADAPSGTALLLARAAAHARGRTLDDAIYGRHSADAPLGPRGGAIALHALRMGDVPGDHTVWLAGPGERLQLGHVATSRETFAVGALRAAAWLQGRAPGLYGMPDVLGLSA